LLLRKAHVLNFLSLEGKGRFVGGNTVRAPGRGRTRLGERRWKNIRVLGMIRNLRIPRVSSRYVNDFVFALLGDIIRNYCASRRKNKGC
jgi:hypothetical protein